MTQRALSKNPDNTQKALREHLKSNQKAIEQSDFVIPSEPKILRLVLIIHTKFHDSAILHSNGKDYHVLQYK